MIGWILLGIGIGLVIAAIVAAVWILSIKWFV